MKEPITINLYDNRGKRWVSWLARMALYAFLALCIWLSNGSTWWTLVTGVLFILTILGMAHRVANPKGGKTEFFGLDELQAWLDRQKVIESLPPGEIIIDPADREAARKAALRHGRLA